MTLEEEVIALRSENAALREQVAALEGQVVELQERIDELQQKGRGTPRFVKANRPKVKGAKAPRRKRKTRSSNLTAPGKCCILTSLRTGFWRFCGHTATIRQQLRDEEVCARALQV